MTETSKKEEQGPPEDLENKSALKVNDETNFGLACFSITIEPQSSKKLLYPEDFQLQVEERQEGKT